MGFAEWIADLFRAVVTNVEIGIFKRVAHLKVHISSSRSSQLECPTRVPWDRKSSSVTIVTQENLFNRADSDLPLSRATFSIEIDSYPDGAKIWSESPQCCGKPIGRFWHSNMRTIGSSRRG
jgi:hypothetical protein